MNKTLKYSGLAILAIIIILQFFQISKVNPPIQAEQDFLNINKPSAEVAAIIKAACYDCHSHETKYPWYTNIVPLSWWIGKHINRGREELNFSTWSTYNDKKADHKLEECVEKVSEKKMPLKSYTLAHSDAKLNAEQIKLLSDYFQSLRKNND
jgi:hypothetical protein